MKNIIKKILKESGDDFDWIRQAPMNVPFDQVIIGKDYRIETTEVFKDALEACDTSDWLHYATIAKVDGKSRNEYNNIFCNHERTDMVQTINLLFYFEPLSLRYNFWVTEDMVTLYEIV